MMKWPRHLGKVAELLASNCDRESIQDTQAWLISGDGSGSRTGLSGGIGKVVEPFLACTVGTSKRDSVEICLWWRY